MRITRPGARLAAISCSSVAHGPARRGQGQEQRRERGHPVVAAQEVEVALVLQPPVMAGNGTARVAHEPDQPGVRVEPGEEQAAGRLLGRIEHDRLLRRGGDRGVHGIRDLHQPRHLGVVRPGPQRAPEPAHMRLPDRGPHRLVPADPTGLDALTHLAARTGRCGSWPRRRKDCRACPCRRRADPRSRPTRLLPSRMSRMVLPLCGRLMT